MKLLFVINLRSGGYRGDFKALLHNYFLGSAHEFNSFELNEYHSIETIKKMIREYQPQRVVAVGGDGTVKLVAECLLYTKIPLGILPAGSANGMAKELQVPEVSASALDLIVNGTPRKIHLVEMNKERCIHLGDIGLNALMIKVFETGITRGRLGYFLAAIKVIWRYPRMRVVIKTDQEVIRTSAAMIVLANATRYGTGALINPIGKLDDDFFEVIVINRISFMEIYKMMVSHRPFNPEKTRVFQTRTLHIHTKRKVHFQVDGEYLGRTNDVHAKVLPDALEVITPFP